MAASKTGGGALRHERYFDKVGRMSDKIADVAIGAYSEEQSFRISRT
jgi:hypothetical protein